MNAFEYHIQFEMPADLNLLLELEGKSCLVKVMAAGKIGHLHIQSGDLIEAELGELNGKEPAFAILDMEKSLIFSDYITPDKERAITEPLMGILLQSGRRKDEKLLKPKENRRYRRFECALPVNYLYREKPEKGLIINIGLGGIFLRTKAMLAIGDKLQVVLYSPSLIEFLPESMKQMGILRTVIIEARASIKDVVA